MIRGIAALLCFQLAGEMVTRLGRLPVPGPICGMIGLLIWLHLRGGIDSELAKVSDTILANMALLFIPVGVGVMRCFDLLARNWPAIALAILLGACTTLLTTVCVARALSARVSRRSRRDDDHRTRRTG